MNVAVLEAAVLGPLRHNAGRTALAIIAIALGVALGLSIYLINRSAADEISLAARSLYGLADLSVQPAGAQTFDEMLYPQIARLPGVANASPEVEVQARLADRRATLKLIGVDVFRYAELQPALLQQSGNDTQSVMFETDAVFLSATAAQRLGLDKDDVLAVQVGLEVVEFKVAGVLPAGVLREEAALLDIATAQWRFDLLGELSRINLRLRSGADTAALQVQIASISDGARVTTPGEASDDALRLSRAYRANLTALGLVALFTGGFFLYSTQALIALRRRREFAVLHALGLTRAEQFSLSLISNAALGLLGSVIGIAVGIALARIGVQGLGDSIGLGYFDGNADTRLQLRVVEAVAFCVLGTAVALVGGLRPALDTARVPTASALKSGDILSGHVQWHRWWFSALVVAAAAIATLPPIAGLPLPGYVSIALLLVAAIVAMPTLIRATLARLPRSASPVYEVAVAQLAGTARYASLSVSAIVVSFSLMVSMAIMVTSFRASLDAWTHRMLPADMYLRVGYINQSAYLDAETARSLETIPGVTQIAVSRLSQATIGAAGRVALIARSFDAARLDESLWITEQSDRAPPLDATPVWLSEAAGDLFALSVGDRFNLNVGGKPLPVLVQGLWRDYEHQGGAVLMERDRYIEVSGDEAVNTVWLWLAPDAAANEVRTAINTRLPANVQYDVRDTRQLRVLSLDVFDRTFAITYVLELVAVAIGLFGIAAGISAQVVARRGEFGALRHLGFTRGQLARMLGIEGSVLGTLGVTVGLAMGVLISFILIYIVNRQSFHWSMDISLPGWLLAGLSAALIGCSAMIAMLSGRQAMSTDAVRAVKEDW